MGMIKTTGMTTPGGRPTGVGNPSSPPGDATGHSDSGGPVPYSVDLGSTEPLLNEGENGGATTTVGGGGNRHGSGWGLRCWSGARCRGLAIVGFFALSLLFLVAQVSISHIALGSTVNPRFRHIDVRLDLITNNTLHMLDELHVLCKVVTNLDDCREMMARMHNKTMHSLNGNNNPSDKSDQGKDPNPPAQPGTGGNEMKNKVATVGPLHFPFDNEAAKRVQALIAHPLIESASNNLSILDNHVRPSSHGIVSAYNSTRWHTYNISTRAYIGIVYRLVPDSVTLESAVSEDTDACGTLIDLLKSGKEFIITYETPNQVKRAFGPLTAEKFESGKYEVTNLGGLVMKRAAAQMRRFSPNQVRRAKVSLANAATQEHQSREEPFEIVPEREQGIVALLETTEVRAPIQTQWPIYSDKMPVRLLTVSSTNYETGAHPTYTPLKIAIDEINADKMGAGLSMNLVRGWNQTDINSLNLMVNKIGKSSDSFFEEAALVRVGCVLNSIVPDAYSIDPTTRRFIRRVSHSWSSVSAHVAKNKAYPKEFKFVVTTTDIVGLYLRNKTFPDVLTEPFKSTTLDKTWTIIPIDPAKYSGMSLVAYVMAFLDSSLWEGSVSYSIDRVVQDEKGNNVNVRYVTMPTCNSVRIPGKKHFMLILANSIGMNAPDTINMGTTSCKVWKNYAVAPNIYDFAGMWYEQFTSEGGAGKLDDLSMHLVRAWNVISDTLATMDTVGRAASIIAELSSNYTYGISRQRWSTGGTANAAWTIGGGSLHKSDPLITTQDLYSGCVGADNGPARRRMVGYNFGYHSSWMSFPQSDARLTIKPLDTSKNPKDYECYWDNLTFSNPQYMIREATSFYRLCMIAGLIETTHQTIPMMTPYGFQSWVNCHGILMAMSVVDFVNQSAIPPTSWFLCTDVYDALTSITMKNANESLTLGLARPNRIEEVAENEASEWGWNRIVDYYGFPYSDNEYDSMMPINSSSMIQWLNKTDQKIPHPTLPTVVIKWVIDGVRTNHRAIACHNTDRISMMVAGSTPDMMFTDYQVRVNWSCLDKAGFAYLWCEQPEMETVTNGEFNSSMMELGKLVPQTLVISNNAWPTQLADSQRAWIIRSLADDNSDMPPYAISPLILPDPIDWKSFLEKIRDWIIYPAAQGGLGYLAAGVPGAVVGAGASLLSKIQKEATGTTKDVLTPISTVAGQVSDAMMKEAAKQGTTIKGSDLANIVKTEVLTGQRGASQGDTSAPQPT
ncbi:MAG: hypothetical protein FZCTV1_gp1 [Hangzhou zicrona caerulea totivirus 1]|nr:MAG: hypothetical protein FZCTV1_gp1 [Hangzhou zicrona caerulea totivirus 1]